MPCAQLYQLLVVGAIGILFFFGNTIAAAMYITGAVEIALVRRSLFTDGPPQPTRRLFQVYIFPQAKLFDRYAKFWPTFRVHTKNLNVTIAKFLAIHFSSTDALPPLKQKFAYLKMRL